MNKMVNGVLTPMTDAEIAQFQASDPSDSEKTAQKWVEVRAKRNSKLQETDWVVTKASETGVAVSDDWKTYRQALRDVPTQSDPDNITWPTKPS
tara:strand:- start:101 stop:382 length:282 start_codon:yes stop_codon:yes gene_type:complete